MCNSNKYRIIDVKSSLYNYILDSRSHFDVEMAIHYTESIIALMKAIGAEYSIVSISGSGIVIERGLSKKWQGLFADEVYLKPSKSRDQCLTASFLSSEMQKRAGVRILFDVDIKNPMTASQVYSCMSGLSGNAYAMNLQAYAAKVVGSPSILEMSVGEFMKHHKSNGLSESKIPPVACRGIGLQLMKDGSVENTVTTDPLKKLKKIMESKGDDLQNAKKQRPNNKALLI